ncbi:hypothetical protein G3O00_39385 [Burkholderia sp. Ac-20384]|uniref:hypothetical protein n=1 Tax=Burkholderia sp. Ac-20384 TaxID=2703902 RepID=UPI00197FFD69|nr:hypothetical protein [Burkholderia sp. Ac-20384]MBN3829609.1 hypothetical protein [Burkholderia sp. Ac-20384]
MKYRQGRFRGYELGLLMTLALYCCFESLLDAVYLQSENELAPMVVAHAIWLALIVGAFSRYVIAIRLLAFVCATSAVVVGFSLVNLASISPILASMLCVGVIIKACTGICMLLQPNHADSFGTRSLDIANTPN